MTRRHIIAGNWKMYKSISEAVSFIQELAPKVMGVGTEVYLAVPFTSLSAAAEAAQGTPIVIGAQNMNDAAEGAFTGEIAARMLLDAGARFVVLGHSERRHLFGESSEFVNQKVRRALSEGLEPIVCIGETLEQREREGVEEVLSEMISESLKGISREEMRRVIIAYEPVWAIGTGHTATPEEAQKVHAFCRQEIGGQWDAALAESIPLLYGGSVKPENASGLRAQPDVDGLLVGGASLDVKVFLQIIDYQTFR